jgi:hypothetical protein
MIILDYVISAVWLSPFLYFSLLGFGKIYHRRRKLTLTKTNKQVKKKFNKIIFQIPTIGNVQLVNKILETVKNYDLNVPLETWTIIEESNMHKAQYVCDKVVVVPADFNCEDLYKSRALEYARRVRQQMVAEGKLESNYLLLQGDDDALPSLEFIRESLTINADISIGTITPKANGLWNTILDYERCVACGIFCNFFTNIGKPLWAHGEGTWLNSEVDKAVSYDISVYTHNTKQKLISSEDSFYFHKASLMGFTIFNSEERIYIMPPLTVSDAIKQRRRWVWGELTILSKKMLPLSNRLRLGLVGFSGLWLYSISILGLPLNSLGVFTIPAVLIPFAYASFALWFGMRAYVIGSYMGWKHGIAGALASYVTVTLNFIIQLIGLAKGDPKKFEVIRKEL